MGTMKTPGVYIVEKSAFPNSVVEAATAIPAFIGYTQQAKDGNKSLLNTPKRINSLGEFILYFGGAPIAKFDLAKEEEGNAADVTLAFEQGTYTLTRKDKYTLFYQMQFFYANGGGTCYIVSVDEGYINELDKDKLIGGIKPLLKEQEPTIVVVPEAVYLKNAQDCYDVQTVVLKHCGMDSGRNRVAIFDIYDGFKSRTNGDDDCVNNFREAIGTEFLDFGAAYYPWLKTSIVSETSVSFKNIDNLDVLKQLLTDELVIELPEDLPEEQKAILDKKKAAIEDYIAKIGTELSDVESKSLHQVLTALSFVYCELMKEILSLLNQLPVSAAMAGLYTLTDSTKEVWKAPANIGISYVISPAVNISHSEQEDLNVPMSGKAVNAIRYFAGEGVKVWGARTLDANSLDWRYINVRRAMIMLEESIKNASRAFVFEPNVANTWVSVRSMISNFLNGIWKRGGLAGASPSDAFEVHIGLGDTMTPEDILEGIMRITVLVAITRPAEFIEITFQQQMQKS